jgi:hypothetical protein
MNQSECRSFFKTVVFVHFPSLNSWLQNTSIDPVATIDAWASTLANVSLNEANSVIIRWTTDRLPRPDYKQMQDFALLIKSVVDRDKHDSKKHLIVQQIRQTPLVDRMPVQMAAYYRAINRNSKRYRDNEISLEECRILNAEILEQASRGIAIEGEQETTTSERGARDECECI